MTSKILSCLCSLAAFCILFSCTKDPHWPPSLKKGDITGKVIIYDSTGAALSNHAGVLVTIDSTNLSAVTDSTGAYTFKKVKAGQYSFTYTKAGYGTYRIIRQLHAGGSQATQLANADVGQIYVGPRCLGAGPMAYGGPENHEIFPFAEFSDPIQVPTAVILFLSVGGSPKTDYIKALRDYQPTNDYPTQYVGPIIQSTLIYGDSILLNAPHITFSMAFDNPKDIHYTNEEGRIIYPCTGPIFGSFVLSASSFTPPLTRLGQRNDGVSTSSQRVRLK